MNYWYAARENEIFLDLDSTKAVFRALRVLRCAMMPAGLQYRHGLDVLAIYHFKTTRAGHSHLVVVLKTPLPAAERALWALWMGSDRLRAVYIFGRLTAGVERFADLLVTQQTYHRHPDASCNCKGKHKPKAITDKCKALGGMLGKLRSTDYFPRVGRRRSRTFRVPWGKVSRTSIIKWENKAKHAKT